MNIKILTPEYVVFDGEVESVLLPGKSGQFQIFKNHAAIVSALVNGKVKIYTDKVGAAYEKYLTKETLKQFQKIMLKYFGIKVTQKGLITKTLPIVGGLIGGTWNYFEVSGIKKRTINYFEGKEI